MRAYLQHHGCHRRRLGSSYFYKESIPKTEGTTHASRVTFSGIILGIFVSRTLLILYGLLIIGAGICFSLPWAGPPLSNVVSMDTTYVSLLTLFGAFPFFDLFAIWLLYFVSAYFYYSVLVYCQDQRTERMSSFIDCLLYLF